MPEFTPVPAYANAPRRAKWFDHSRAPAVFVYDFDGGMFDAGVEGGEFHAFAGSWVSQVEVGERFTLPRRRLERMVARPGNPLVPHTRSWAGRWILHASQVERLVRLGAGFTEGGFRFRSRAGISQQLLPSLVVLPGEKETGKVGDIGLLLRW